MIHMKYLRTRQQVYLQLSPGFSDVFAVWDSHHLNNAEKVCVPLICLLADMLRFSPENSIEAESFVHLQLDGLARNIMQHRMRAVFNHLSSGVRVRQNCALALLTSIASRNRSLAFELYRNFDFSTSSLNRLAIPRSSDRSNTASNRPRKEWTWMDPFSLPTRHMFVYFILAFLERRDKTLLHHLLAQKALLGNVMRHVASDPKYLICRTLRLFREIVVCPESRVPFRLRAALCGDCSLEQLTVICGSSNERHHSEDGISETHTSAAIAANLAQDIIMRICTDPSIGVCPQTDVRKQGMGSLLDTNQILTMADEQANTTYLNEDVKVVPNFHTNVKDFSTQSKGDDKKAATIVRLLRKLRPVESPNHAELLLTVCALFPQIASMYIRGAQLSVEPRPSVMWLITASHTGRIMLAASRDNIKLPHHSIIEKHESMSFYRAVMPPCLDKAVFTRGLQHESGLVRHATLSLLLHVMRAIRTRVAILEESIVAMAAQKGDHVAAYIEFIASIRRDAVSFFPDPRMFSIKRATRDPTLFVETNCPVQEQNDRWAVENIISCKNRSNNEESRLNNKVTRQVDEKLLCRTHTINALAEYADIVGVDRCVRANLDLTRCHLTSPLSRPTSELAARIRLISAFYTIKRLRIGNTQHFDSPEGSITAEIIAPELPSASRSDAATHAIRMGQGEVYNMLSVVACTNARSVRCEAMHLAAAHLQACGVLQNSEPADQEALIWLSHLPARPADAAHAVCTFLADAVCALERIRRRSYGHELRTNDTGTNPDTWLCTSPLVNFTLSKSLKVLQSPRKTRMQRLAIAAYISSVLLDLLPRQDDPLPMAAFVLRSMSPFHDALKPNNVAQFPSLDSLALFAEQLINSNKKGIQNCGFRIYDVKDRSESSMRTFRDEYRDTSSVRSTAADIISRISQTAFHDDDDDGRSAMIFEELMSASRPVLACAIELLPENNYQKEIAGLAINAHGPLLPVELLLSVHKSHDSVPFSALIGSAVDPHQLAFPLLANVAVSTFKEVCSCVIRQIPASELLSAARVLKFWCNIAVASTCKRKHEPSKRRQKVNSNQNRSRSIFCVSAALLARADVLEASFPLIGTHVRRILFESSALSDGCFSSNYFTLAASVNLIVIGYADNFEVVPGAEVARLIDQGACIVRHTISGKCDREAMRAFLFLHLLHLTTTHQQKNLITSVGAIGSIINEISCALAVEAISASLPKGSLSASDTRHIDLHNLFSRSLEIVLNLDAANVSDKKIEGTMARACQVAFDVISSARLSTASRIIFSEPSTLPAAYDVLHRVISKPESHLMRLAFALTSMSTTYLDEFISLVAAEIKTGKSNAKLVLLFPAVRYIVESHSAFRASSLEAYAREYSCVVSDDLRIISTTFRQMALEYFKGNSSSFNSSSLNNVALTLSTTESVLLNSVRPHAAIVLAATHSIAPCDEAARCAQKDIIMPSMGWCFPEITSIVCFSMQTYDMLSQLIDERAKAARIVARTNEHVDIGTRRAYLNCLISTLRMLILISMPNSEANVPSFMTFTSSGINALLIRDQLIGDVQFVLAMATNDTVLCRPSSVLTARALARAIFCQNFVSAGLLSLLRHLVNYLFLVFEDCSSLRTHCNTVVAPAMKLVISSFAQDAFERAVSQCASTEILLGNHAAALFVDVDHPSSSFDTLLASAICEGNDRCDDLPVERNDSPRLNVLSLSSSLRCKSVKTSERLKLQLVKLLRSLWTLQAVDDVSKRNDRSQAKSRPNCSTTHVTNQISLEIWRAKQARVIPLLAAAHGASLSSFDRHTSAMLVSLDAASGGGALADLGYLWGSAADHFYHSQAARQGPGVKSHDLSGNLDVHLNGIDLSKLHADAVATALRATATPDPRQCAISMLHLACSHRPSSITFVPTFGQIEQPVSQNIPGYNPAWVLPFALRAIKSQAIELRDCVAWGLIPLAFAATSSTDKHLRCVAYAVISAAADAANTGRSFKERTQLVALFSIFQNSITKKEPLRRLSTITAIFAAETAFVCMHPENEMYISLQRAVIRRATLDTEAFPIGFLNFLNGSLLTDDSMASRNNRRMLRVWLLRLLTVSLCDASDAHLFRKSFAIEVLMSHRFAAFFLDPYAQKLAFDVITRAAQLSLLTKPLIEGSALLSWLAATAKCACHPIRSSIKNTNIGAITAAAAASALTDVVSARGAIYGGPTGTAADSLSALRIIRSTLFPAAATENNIFFSKGNAHGSAFCTVLLSALKFQATLAKQLSNRRVEVFDISELVELCRAVDNVDTMSVDATLILLVNSAVLDMIVTTAGAMRKNILVFGSDRCMQTTMAIAKSILTVVIWAASAVTKGGDRFLMEEYASIILKWATSFLLSEKEEVIAQLVDPDGGVGATQVALSLGSLHNTAGPRHRCATVSELVRAQAELLRALSNRCRQFPCRVSKSDEHVCIVMSTPVYTVLLSNGGALEELISEVKSGHFKAATPISARGTVKSSLREFKVHAVQDMEDKISQANNFVHSNVDPSAPEELEVQQEIRGKKLTAARLAAILLQAVFTAMPPLAFLESATRINRTRISAGCSAKISYQFRFEKHLEGFMFGKNLDMP